MFSHTLSPYDAVLRKLEPVLRTLDPVSLDPGVERLSRSSTHVDHRRQDGPDVARQRHHSAHRRLLSQSGVVYAEVEIRGLKERTLHPEQLLVERSLLPRDRSFTNTWHSCDGKSGHWLRRTFQMRAKVHRERGIPRQGPNKPRHATPSAACKRAPTKPSTSNGFQHAGNLKIHLRTTKGTHSKSRTTRPKEHTTTTPDYTKPHTTKNEPLSLRPSNV